MKELIWLGSTLDDLKSFPEEVQDEMGYALYCAQRGETHPSAKLFKGMDLVFTKLSVTLIQMLTE